MVDYALSGLKTLDVYTIRVSVENGVSDQDKRRERNANSCETIGSTGDSSKFMHSSDNRINVPYILFYTAELNEII